MEKRSYISSIILASIACFAIGMIHFAPKIGLCPFWDTVPGNNKISYIYAPGLICSELLMARYCPEYTASTGEKISSKKGGHVIGQPHTCVIFPDVDLRKPTGFTLNPLRAIINGIRRDLFPIAAHFLTQKYGVTVIDNPDSAFTVVNYLPLCSGASIGQKRDIKALQRQYHEHITRYPDTDIVLYGDSRGAATIFNFIALHQPANVKAAVLEGIFDTVPHCIKHFLYDTKDPQAEWRLHQFLSFTMKKYRKKGINPLQCAEFITDDIPLLLVTSLNDGIVPPQATIKLYKRLTERSHQNVHLLVLKKASHPLYMLDDPDDQQLYESTVHAFYKQYNLPYNSIKAALGRKTFLATQPDVQELARLYPLARCALCQ